MKNILIGYCCMCDPYDINSWSGTHFFMRKGLEKYCGKVIVIGFFYYKLMRLISKVSSVLFKKPCIIENGVFFKKSYIRYLQKKINRNRYAFLFFPIASDLLAGVNTETPTVYLSDATYTLLVDYYPGWFDRNKNSVKLVMKNEETAIRKATKIVYPSEWAARSAIEDYGCQKDKVYVIPFGANLETRYSRNEVLSYKKSQTSTCKLLLVGRDWFRKGGQIAFDTMIELNKRGIDTELTICGCLPPDNIKHDKLKITGFLDKKNKEETGRLTQLYMNSSFLLLPTRAECFGIVFAEAAAHGLPVITTRTGGVSSYVKDQFNGYLLSNEANHYAYADVIEKIWGDKKLYLSLCENSKDIYDKELNWDSWGEKMAEVVSMLVKK